MRPAVKQWLLLAIKILLQMSLLIQKWHWLVNEIMCTLLSFKNQIEEDGVVIINVDIETNIKISGPGINIRINVFMIKI